MAGLAILALLALTPGCAYRPDDKTADGRTIVTYWEKWTGFEGEAMQAVVDDFNASQSRIEVRKLVVSDIQRKLKLATAGGNPPDLAGLMSQDIPVYSEKGALTPLDGLCREAGIAPGDYIPVIWSLCRHRGLQWALPTTPATLALHWNKKLFREAGLDPERAPRTIEELDRFAERLTLVEATRGGQRKRLPFPELTADERERHAFELVRLGFTPSEPGWWNTVWGYWFGARLWDGDRAMTVASPENIKAFDWFQGYMRKYGYGNLREFGASFGTFSSPQNPFLSGQVAMVLQGVWMFNFIDKYAPGFEWGVAPFPSVDPAALPRVTLCESDVLVIPKGARHRREAFEFMRYVQRPPVLEKLTLGQRKFSPLLQESEAFVRAHPNPYIGVFSDLARSPNAGTIPRLAVYHELYDEMNVACDRLFNVTVTPERALRETQARVQRAVDRAAKRWAAVGDRRLREWRRQP